MTQINPQNWATIKQTAQLYPAFSEKSLRWFAYHSDTNNLESCIRRIGGKILLHLPSFEIWIESYTSRPKKRNKKRVDK